MANYTTYPSPQGPQAAADIAGQFDPNELKRKRQLALDSAGKITEQNMSIAPLSVGPGATPPVAQPAGDAFVGPQNQPGYQPDKKDPDINWSREAYQGLTGLRERASTTGPIAAQVVQNASLQDALGRQQALQDVHRGTMVTDSVTGQPVLDPDTGEPTYKNPPKPSLFRKIAAPIGGFLTGGLNIPKSIEAADRIKYAPQYADKASLFERNKALQDSLKTSVDVEQAITQRGQLPMQQANAEAALINAAQTGTGGRGGALGIQTKVAPDGTLLRVDLRTGTTTPILDAQGNAQKVQTPAAKSSGAVLDLATMQNEIESNRRLAMAQGLPEDTWWPKDINGNVIRVDGSSPHKVWRVAHLPNGETRFEGATDTTKFVTAGNVVYETANVGGTAAGTRAIGQADPGKLTMKRERRVNTATGAIEEVDVPETQTGTYTPGASMPANQPGALPLSPATPGAPGGGMPPTPAGTPAETRTPDEWKGNEMVRRANIGFSALMGGPADPDIPYDEPHKGLVDNLATLDSPGSSERIGTAISMILENSGRSGADPDGTVHAGPVTIGLGQVGQWVAGKLGMSPAATAADVRAQQDYMRTLSPQERETVQAYMTAIAGLMSLRGITGQTAYRWAAEQVVNEFGVPGRGLAMTSKEAAAAIARVLKNEVGFFDGVDPVLLQGRLGTWKQGLGRLNAFAQGRPFQPAGKPAAAPRPAAGPTVKNAGTNSYVVQGRTFTFKAGSPEEQNFLQKTQTLGVRKK